MNVLPIGEHLLEAGLRPHYGKRKDPIERSTIDGLERNTVLLGQRRLHGLKIEPRKALESVECLIGDVGHRGKGRISGMPGFAWMPNCR